MPGSTFIRGTSGPHSPPDCVHKGPPCHSSTPSPLQEWGGKGGNRAPTETAPLRKLNFPSKDGEPMPKSIAWSIKQVQLSMASWYFYRPLAVTIVCLLM